MNGITFGQCAFTDLDFADDTSILAELLELLVPALEIFQEEATALDLEVNWQKTMVQALGSEFCQGRAFKSLYLWARCPTYAVICLPRSYDSLVLWQRSRDTQAQCHDTISNAEP